MKSLELLRARLALAVSALECWLSKEKWIKHGIKEYITDFVLYNI